jgi:hypothetical protein
VPSWAQWSWKPSSILTPEKPDGLVWETRQSSLADVVNWFWLLSWSLSSLLGSCSAVLPPLLDLSPCWASLHHWPKSRSSALSALGYFLIRQ